MNLAGILANPMALAAIAIGIIVLVITGALFVIFAPEMMAAVFLGLVGAYVLIRSPFPDPKWRIIVPVALWIAAAAIYMWW